jgi:hypothetical protein
MFPSVDHHQVIFKILEYGVFRAMSIAIHAPYSKFCTGLSTVKRSKQIVKVKIRLQTYVVSGSKRKVFVFFYNNYNHLKGITSSYGVKMSSPTIRIMICQ